MIERREQVESTSALVELLAEQRAGEQAAGGIVYLVGAGPGDPGLITVRARELLADCDAVVYDALANPVLLPEARETPAGRKPELYDVGKRGGVEASARQESINELLVQLAREGKRVVRLKGGDPFVFGRGSEEAQALHEAGVPFEVVPGVTAGVAAPAYAGIPVTHRAVATAVTFVTGSEDPNKPDAQTNWRALAQSGSTIVLYMGIKTLPRITQALIEGGMAPDTPAATVQSGTWPHQRSVVGTVATLVDAVTKAGLGSPAITVIGDVVSLRDEIAWFDRRPLHGKRIVVTRARAQASALTSRLRVLGADVLEMPATRIEWLEPEPLAGAIQHLEDYQWLVFTSQNAVQRFWEVLRGEGKDARALSHAKLCAVGPATAEALQARGLQVDVIPSRFVAEGVLQAMRGRSDVGGARVLYAAAQGAREVLTRGLTEMGAEVEMIPVYRSVADGEGARLVRRVLEDGGVDLVTFTSASAVQAFVEAVGHSAARHAPGASIGPITSEAVREAGIELLVEAQESSIPGLVEAIERKYARG